MGGKDRGNENLDKLRKRERERRWLRDMGEGKKIREKRQKEEERERLGDVLLLLPKWCGSAKSVDGIYAMVHCLNYI
jgi:hypothetical protein